MRWRERKRKGSSCCYYLLVGSSCCYYLPLKQVQLWRGDPQREGGGNSGPKETGLSEKEALFIKGVCKFWKRRVDNKFQSFVFASRAKGIKSFNSSWVRWICVWPAWRRKRWNLEELQSVCPPKPFSLGPLSSMGGKWTWISFPFYWMLNFWNWFERLGARGGSLWPIRGNIRGSHIMFRAQSTPSPYCCHLKVFYCWCKNRPKSSLSQKKRGTSWTFFLQDICCIFQSL